MTGIRCHLATAIARRRAERGLTLAEVGEKANMTGQGVMYVENGSSKRPSFYQIMRLCKALDLDPWSLMP